MSDELTRELIDRLAGVLGQAAPHVYAVFVRQQSLAALLTLAGIALWLVLTGFAVWRLWRWGRLAPGADPVGIAAVGVIAGAFVGALLVAVVGESLLHLLNPEYYAIRELLRGGR